MARGLELLSEKVKNLLDQVQRLDRAEANPNIQIDIREAEAKLKQLQADLQRLQGQRLQITADTARTRAELNAVQRQLGELQRQAADGIDVDAQIAEAEAKIAELKAQLAGLKQQRLDFDANTATVKAQIAEIEALLKTLRDVHINVDMDTTAATAQAVAFRGVLGGLFRDGNAFTNSLRAISAAIGPVVSGFGSAVSGVGNFVQAVGGGIAVISGLGSAISSIGSSITSGGQALTQFGTAASGAFSALASAGASIGLAVAQLSALAGAGALAVAALGQIGGAAIALGSGIVPLVQSLGLLPGLIAPAAVGIGALAVAFSDADTKGSAMQRSLQSLQTAFQPIVNSIRSQLQPALTQFLGSLESLAPVVQRVVPQITSALSQVINSFSQLFRSSSFQADFQNLLSGAAQNIRVFGDAARNAFQGLTNIAVAAQPAVNRIAQDIADAAQRFNEWTAAARQSGELTTIFNQVATVLEQIGSTVTNIAGLFVDLWNSANRTGAFTSTLQAINQGITQFRDYVNEAGGAWDQLMAKAGSITQSLVGLVGSIGQAFVQLGSQIDISASIDAISQAIQRVTPAFIQIGQQANTVFQQIITIAGRAAQALGPSIAQSLQAIGTAIQTIDWESVVTGVATVIQAFTNLTNAASTVAQMFGTFEQAIMQITSGDFGGAAQSFERLGQLWEQLKQSLTDVSGINAAKDGVQGLNQELNNIKSPPPVQINAQDNASGVAQAAAHNITAIPGNWISKFIGDAQNLVATAQQADQTIQAVPPTHTTTFTGEGGNLLAAAAGGQQAIQGVVPDWLTKFAGDAASLISAAQQADQQVQSIPVEHKVMITGDASGATSAASQATSSLGSVVDKSVTISATDNVTAAANAATAALNAIADKNVNITANNSAALNAIQAVQSGLQSLQDKVITISVNDQASSVIANIANQINSLQNRTITITTVYQTVGAPPGGAMGMIYQPMAKGGITYSRSFGNLLPMAGGGMASPRLRPMSAGMATIVQPNTWRIIGDRASGAEAFIPINRSPRSRALLHETARRMGEVTIPKNVIHYRHGGWWDWWRRHRPRTPKPPPMPPLPPVASTIGTSMLQRLRTDLAFGSSGGVASYIRNVKVPQTQVIPPGSGGAKPPKTIFLDSNNALIQELLRIIRAEIRKQGGDVQTVLGI